MCVCVRGCECGCGCVRVCAKYNFRPRLGAAPNDGQDSSAEATTSRLVSILGGLKYVHRLRGLWLPPLDGLLSPSRQH